VMCSMCILHFTRPAGIVQKSGTNPVVEWASEGRIIISEDSSRSADLMEF